MFSGQSTAVAEEVEVTPERAKVWLESNGHNRSLRPALIHSYARDMREGRWRRNGEAIKFDRFGNLLDGQHRLHAVVAAELTVVMLVVHGLEPESQETMDSGARRTAGDALRLLGRQPYNMAAAVARRVILWDAGARWSDCGLKPTNTEIVRWVEGDPRVVKAAEIASRYRPTIKAPPSVVGLCWWLFSQIDEEEANDFFARLADGANLDHRHPILTLRNRLDNVRDGAGRGLTPERVTAVLIRAWNAFREGRRLATIPVSLWERNGDYPEPR
jgi:hypothetical protein